MWSPFSSTDSSSNEWSFWRGGALLGALLGARCALRGWRPVEEGADCVSEGNCGLTMMDGTLDESTGSDCCCSPEEDQPPKCAELPSLPAAPPSAGLKPMVGALEPRVMLLMSFVGVLDADLGVRLMLAGLVTTVFLRPDEDMVGVPGGAMDGVFGVDMVFENECERVERVRGMLRESETEEVLPLSRGDVGERYAAAVFAAEVGTGL